MFYTKSILTQPLFTCEKIKSTAAPRNYSIVRQLFLDLLRLRDFYI